MIMDQQVHDIRIENWKRLILEANASSLTKTEWCRQNDINPKTFYYWQRKLRRIEAEKVLSPSTLPEISESKAGAVPSAFVDLTHLYNEEPASVKNQDNPIPSSFSPQLMLMDGQYRILIGEAVQEQTLVTLLRAIRNAQRF